MAHAARSAGADELADARRLMLRNGNADSSSVSTLPSIAASGLTLLARAEERLARSAQQFTRSAEPTGASGVGDGNDDGARDPAADVVDAAIGVVYGRTAFATGIALLTVGRDTEKALLDVLA